MGNSKSKTISEIAQELDVGNDCYFNPKTDEIIAIPSISDVWDEEEFRECFKAELKTLKKNRDRENSRKPVIPRKSQRANRYITHSLVCV